MSSILFPELCFLSLNMSNIVALWKKKTFHLFFSFLQCTLCFWKSSWSLSFFFLKFLDWLRYYKSVLIPPISPQLTPPPHPRRTHTLSFLINTYYNSFPEAGNMLNEQMWGLNLAWCSAVVLGHLIYIILGNFYVTSGFSKPCMFPDLLNINLPWSWFITSLERQGLSSVHHWWNTIVMEDYC